MNSRTRKAFTLVELLVVIAIIGILIAMLLPAVERHGNLPGERSVIIIWDSCVIAVHNYETAHGFYPAGTIDRGGPIVNAPKGYHHNWIVQILPYFEEQNAWRHIDKTVGVYDKKNATIRSYRIGTLVCPSSATRGPDSNYAGAHHDAEAPIDVDNNGVFFLNSQISYDDVTDGSTHTIFIGEKLVDANELGWMSGTRATLRNMGTPINVTGVRPKAPGPGYHEKRNGLDASDSANDTDAAKTPDADAAPGGSRAKAPDPAAAVGGFSSEHPGGANFAMGDGSVRFVTETINLQLYQQLGHRADGKLISSSDF